MPCSVRRVREGAAVDCGLEIAYSQYALREEVVDWRLVVRASKLLGKCGIGVGMSRVGGCDELFAGEGVWCREALGLVLEDVGVIDAGVGVQW
jgi:hypothetical protein